MDSSKPDFCVVILTLTNNPTFKPMEILSILHRQKGAAFEIVLVKTCNEQIELPEKAGIKAENILSAIDEPLGAVFNRIVDLKKDSKVFAFLTDSAQPSHDHWLKRLIAPIVKDGAKATFGREIPDGGGNYFIIEDMKKRFPTGAGGDADYFSMNNCSVLREELSRRKFSHGGKCDPLAIWIADSQLKPTYHHEAMVLRRADQTLLEVFREAMVRGKERAACGIKTGFGETMLGIFKSIFNDLKFCVSLKKPQYTWYPFLYRPSLYFGLYFGNRKISVNSACGENEKN